MVRQRGIIAAVMCGVILCASVSHALEEESLFSENTAALFIKHASEIHQEDPLDFMRTEQAMTLLTAAASLDITPGQIPEQMLGIGAGRSYDGQDYSDYLAWALDRYLNDRSDLEVVFNALRSMMDSLNSRIDREVFLEKLFRKYSSVNGAFASEVATQLGLLAVEKADMQTALNYLSGAAQLNPYNQLAVNKFLELSTPQEGERDQRIPVLHARRVLETCLQAGLVSERHLGGKQVRDQPQPDPG